MNQDGIRLSVIIPMYQAEKYIRECIESVLYQKVEQIEILCIDDGSTDHTCRIVEDIITEDPRVQLFHMEHGGVSKARNKGLQQSKGRYVLFLDADDMLMPGKLSTVLRKAEQRESDILIFSGTTNTPYSTPLWIREAFASSNQFYETFSPEMFLREKSCRPSACNKLYRNQYLISHHYQFPEDLSLAEDHVFQFIVFPKAKNITFTRCRLYLYRIQQEYSTMEYYTKQVEERTAQHRKALERIAEIWNNEGYLAQDMCQKIYIDTYLELLYYELFKMPDSRRKSYATSIYQDLRRFGVNTSLPSKRLQILQCYSEKRIREAEQLISDAGKQSCVQKIRTILSGPIRYYRKVGMRSTVEHYIGRLLQTEP